MRIGNFRFASCLKIYNLNDKFETGGGSESNRDKTRFNVLGYATIKLEPGLLRGLKKLFMDNIQNENNFEKEDHSSYPDKKPGGRRGLAFLVVAMMILTIFISATFGAFFGFLASRSGSGMLTELKSGGITSLFSKENKSSSTDVIKQNIIQEDSAVIDVVKKTSPAVVSIVISKDVSYIQNSMNSPDFFGDPFGFFFGGQPGNSYNQNGNNSRTEKQTVGGGTGFFITRDGMIVTNRHVVDDASADYTVVTKDNKQYPAKVLARDPVNDIAVIKIEGNDFPTLSLGNSDSVQVGETVIAIGNSLGEFSNTVSRGIVSGLQRTVTAGSDSGAEERLTGTIQTDAAINPGNSGGPLLDINGSVIGINVAIAEGAQSIGFAIPSNQVEKVVEQVKTTGKISVPYIGVRYLPIDDSVQKQNNLPYNYGALVIRGQQPAELAVVPGSPADKAGIVENDVILEVDGEKVDQNDNTTLTSLISKHNVGDTITLKVWHKGEVQDVKVTLAERNSGAN